MYRTISLAGVGVLFFYSSPVQMYELACRGNPIGSGDSDGAVLQAVKHALPPDEQNCPLDLLTAGDAQQATKIADKQVVSVKICGRSQRFSIQRSQVNADTVLVTARKI
jgi:hypothetical protein